jgi:SPX domain protein involved in polyphosphate accumulation
MSGAEGGHEERHELKFAAYAIHRSEVQHWLHMHPAGFIQPYPDRQVNNLYFDTFDYRAYAENLAGVSERSKVRYRWYGDSAGPGAGSLEVKQKRNYFGWKLRFSVPDAPYHAGATWAEVRDALHAQLPQDGQLWLDQNPLPVIINRYARQYFCTADAAIRATIDTHQRVFDQRNGNQPNFDRSAIMQDSLVVEFKFSRKDRHRVVEMLSGFPVRVARHSKFMNGLRAVGLV